MRPVCRTLGVYRVFAIAIRLTGAYVKDMHNPIVLRFMTYILIYKGRNLWRYNCILGTKAGVAIVSALLRVNAVVP